MEATTLITPFFLTIFIFVFFAANGRKKPEQAAFSVSKRTTAGGESLDLSGAVIQILKSSAGEAKFTDLVKEGDQQVKVSGYVGIKLSKFDATVTTKHEQGMAKILVEGSLVPSLLLYVLIMTIALILVLIVLGVAASLLGAGIGIAIALVGLVIFAYQLFTLQKSLKKKLVAQLSTALEKLEFAL